MVPFVSLTRLRLRALRFYPPFIWHTMANVRQLTRSDGFLDGLLASEGGAAFWTITAWRDEEAMLAFRDTGAHRTAMAKLAHWCDEASVARFEQETSQLPTCAEAASYMKTKARLSKVRYPSMAQKTNNLGPTISVPRPGMRLCPRQYS